MSFACSRSRVLRVHRLPGLSASSCLLRQHQIRTSANAGTGETERLKRVNRQGNRYTTHPDAAADKTHLPPRDQWRQIFSWVPVNDRISISNPDSAAVMADLFVPEGSKDKVIVEAFPGPGQLTRSLLALPKERIKKLIILEQEPKYLDYLLPLAELDPRVKIIPVTALEWDAFARIEQQGLLDDVEVIDWDQGVHPTLQFISHLPITVYGEQLIAQLLRLVPSRSWLHKFGRIKMNYLLSQYVWERLNAPPSHTTMRCKLSVMASATASLKPLMDEELRPFAKHFHPTPPKNSTKVTNRQVGNPFLAIEIIPLEERIIDETKLEMWDYCCRRLFVRKATPLTKCIEDLGPGAKSLLPKLKEFKIDDKAVRDLTVYDWAEIVKAFDAWPFAPKDLGINDGKLDDYGGRGGGPRY